MAATEDIRDIFSILHDGGITSWIGDKNLLTLTIECKYLAERIDKKFDVFFVELLNVYRLELEPWTIPINLPTVIKTQFDDIFKAELEILSAEIKEDTVLVTCNQHSKKFDYCGGNMTISCQSIKVFDQNKNELTIEEFEKICDEYWDEWSKK